MITSEGHQPENTGSHVMRDLEAGSVCEAKPAAAESAPRGKTEARDSDVKRNQIRM